MMRLARMLFPELRRLETDDSRLRAWRYATRQTGRRPGYWLAMLGALALNLGLLWLIQTLLPISTRAFWRGVNLAVLGVCLAGLWCWASRRYIRRGIRRYLTETGKPCCIRCGYDLTGNRSGVCPECGHANGASAALDN